MGQVAGTVVTVAAFYRGGYGGFAFAFGRSRRDGQLAFQTAEGVEGVAAGQPALGAAGFAVQPVAFDVGDGFAVKGDPVQVAAAVAAVHGFQPTFRICCVLIQLHLLANVIIEFIT